MPVAEAEARLDFVYIRTLTANSEMTASRQPFEEYGCRVLAGSCLSVGIGPVFWSTTASDPQRPVTGDCFAASDSQSGRVQPDQQRMDSQPEAMIAPPSRLLIRGNRERDQGRKPPALQKSLMPDIGLPISQAEQNRHNGQDERTDHTCFGTDRSSRQPP